MSVSTFEMLEAKGCFADSVMRLAQSADGILLVKDCEVSTELFRHPENEKQLLKSGSVMLLCHSIYKTGLKASSFRLNPDFTSCSFCLEEIPPGVKLLIESGRFTDALNSMLNNIVKNNTDDLSYLRDFQLESVNFTEVVPSNRPASSPEFATSSNEGCVEESATCDDKNWAENEANLNNQDEMEQLHEGGAEPIPEAGFVDPNLKIYNSRGENNVFGSTYVHIRKVENGANPPPPVIVQRTGNFERCPPEFLPKITMTNCTMKNSVFGADQVEMEIFEQPSDI